MKYRLALICAALSAAAHAEVSASFRADERHRGIYPGTGMPMLHGVKWKFRTHGAIVSTPAIADGVAYIGSNDHYLYALDAAGGAERWKFKTGSRVASSPAVYAGRVYFSSYDGNVYALDARSGKPRWQFAFEGEHRFTAKHLHGAQPGPAWPRPGHLYQGIRRAELRGGVQRLLL